MTLSSNANNARPKVTVFRKKVTKKAMKKFGKEREQINKVIDYHSRDSPHPFYANLKAWTKFHRDPREPDARKGILALTPPGVPPLGDQCMVEWYLKAFNIKLKLGQAITSEVLHGKVHRPHASPRHCLGPHWQTTLSEALLEPGALIPAAYLEEGYAEGIHEMNKLPFITGAYSIKDAADFEMKYKRGAKKSNLENLYAQSDYKSNMYIMDRMDKKSDPYKKQEDENEEEEEDEGNKFCDEEESSKMNLTTQGLVRPLLALHVNKDQNNGFELQYKSIDIDTDGRDLSKYVEDKDEFLDPVEWIKNYVPPYEYDDDDDSGSMFDSDDSGNLH